MKAQHDEALLEWRKTNPEPPKPGLKPTPKQFGLERKHQTLRDRRYYYHDTLGNSGARIGGLSSKSPIHVDGHTWFPPGWEAKPLMELLETNQPGIVKAPRMADGVVAAVERVAWVKKSPDGAYSVAAPEITDPKAAGYLKTKMITPADGATRSVFPEMHQ